MDKLEFTDWSQVNWMFGTGEMVVFPTGDDDCAPLRKLGLIDYTEKIEDP